MITTTKTQFEFHRVGWELENNNSVSGWYLYISNQEELKAWLHYNAIDMVEVWKDIKDSPEDKEGHCRTTRAAVHKSLLNIEMIRRAGGSSAIGDKTRLQMSLCDSLEHMENLSTRSVIEIFNREGSVYVGSKGGCRSTTLNTEKLQDKVFEVYKSKKLIFPVLSKSDIKISKWQGGNHFYLQVNGHNVIVDNKIKWKTVEAAEEAKKTYIRRNRYKMKDRQNEKSTY
ncbi:hypothetical protein LCGC14_1732100 [marine sediment metagenome]|uniref:Uncharacterized protein n=1 Tax=marine sediment metagenome TaxID=412755 RepID=A0A0F9H917_9ZZZZ